MSNSIRTGDAVFIRTGSPAIVQEKDDISGKLVLGGEPEVVRENMRHGYINGITKEVRGQLYEILDGVKGDTTDPFERSESLRLKIEELEQDPRNLDLTRYLRAEMVHIMNTYNIKPKQYSITESKAR